MISIIIPMYNVEKYIETTINSIKNQTYDNYEVILIDDGSTDNTLEIVKKIVENDKRYKIFTQENKGVSATRNKGIKLAKGEYIYFLDGDDAINKDLLRDAINIFENTKVDIFSFGYELNKKNKKRLFSNMEQGNKIFTSYEFLKKLLNYEIKQSICSVIYKKQIINNYQFNTELCIGEDLDFQIRVLLENDNKTKVYYSSKIYFYYMYRKNSAMSNSKINLKNLNSLYFLDELGKKMEKKGIEEYKKYHILRFFSELYWFLDKNPNKEEYKKIKEEYKKYNHILKKLEFRLSKLGILLYIQKIAYLIDIKVFYYFRKILYILQKVIKNN